MDGNLFILQRLKATEHPPFGYVTVSTDYRKILAIDIRDTVDPNGETAIRSIRLLDVTNSILSLDPADKEV